MSIARHHAEWLSLLETSGPFLSMPVLLEAFPQGLDAHDADQHRMMRVGHGEWEDNRHRPATHAAWVRYVLARALDYSSEVLAAGQAIPQTLQAEVPEHRELLRPDFVLHERGDPNKPRLLIQTYPHTQDLSRPVPGLPWKASPDTRMAHLLHATGVRLGLVTNGERWILVNAPRGETTGFASWYATLWLEEPVTFRVFRTLLGVQRFFGVKDEDTPEQLLARSAANQQEVTDQLGYQVRRAVEVLIQSLDRADQDRGRELLVGVREGEMYEAALTVMMRLVFLFCAEERELLLLGDPIYDQHYAVSTVREQLQQTASQYGEEILERRHDAWCRLLVAFRAVHGGVWHDDLKLPAYGGRLFDPDRFPLLEGRKPGTSWRAIDAVPLPVNNRTVLHLLESLQTLETKLPGDREIIRRRLSVRSLDIEQIGHVYEGLLDHTARRATEPHLGLAGTKDKEPEVPLAELEARKLKGDKELLAYLKEATGKSEPALKKLLAAQLDAQQTSRFRAACQGDDSLWKRVQPFAGLVRMDSFGYPVVIPAGSVYVTEGTDRRSSGTHYTPRSLTEPIVQYTLEPLVYVGPAEGLPRKEWKLKPAKELLDLKVCDMACGSGAFLVQACRYLAERLQEAWQQEEQRTKGQPRVAPEGLASAGKVAERVLEDDRARQIEALRLVAQRCLYGVDKNPLAVEMAKLSLWLLTLAKDRPFEFLDHAVRCGDSLVGIRDLKQLECFDLAGEGATNSLFLDFLRNRIPEAIELRRRIEVMPANTVDEVEQQERLLAEAEDKLERLKLAADLLIAAELTPGTAGDRLTARDDNGIKVAVHFHREDLTEFLSAARKALAGQPTFHWPLEFPEVMVDRGGFDAFVGNPPFMGNKYWSANVGEFLTTYSHNILGNKPGHSDLCALFHRRAEQLLSRTGCSGLIGCDSLREGDSLKVGLQPIATSSMIYRATSSLRWPGSATVRVCTVWVSRCKSRIQRILDDQEVDAIDGRLIPGIIQVAPAQLTRELVAGGGCHNARRESFLLSRSDAWWVRLNAAKSPYLRQYISGEDLNDHALQNCSRWAVYTGADSLELIERKCQLARQFLEEVVRPIRTSEYLASFPGLAARWWQFHRPSVDLFSGVAKVERYIVIGMVSKYVVPARVPSSWISTNKLCVIAENRADIYPVLLSSFSDLWIRTFSGSLGETLSVSLTKGVQTLPLPVVSFGGSLQQPAALIEQAQLAIISRDSIGFTDLYNRSHNPDQRGVDFKDIDALRELHIEMDRAVAAAYGWADLDLGHGFHDTKQGQRFTISEAARREVLARLLKLNHDRYAEEVRQGLHEKKKPTAAKKPRKAKANAADVGTLFE